MNLQLKNAEQQMQAARARYIATTGKKAMRETADDLEFWSNKAATLAAMVSRNDSQALR